jgi:hypothetical protein
VKFIPAASDEKSHLVEVAFLLGAYATTAIYLALQLDSGSRPE